jgi:hypothetical protein
MRITVPQVAAARKNVTARTRRGLYDAAMTTLEAAVAADLITAAVAPEAADQLAAFAPLIGSWDTRYWYRTGLGREIEGTGYVHFGWGLNGRAIVDLWGFEDGTVGTTIRYYDAKIDGYRSTWICPARNALLPFVGRVLDGRIILNAVLGDPPGRRLRWTFVAIEAERFDWTGELSDDDGVSWLLTQRISGTRRNAA